MELSRGVPPDRPGVYAAGRLSERVNTMFVGRSKVKKHGIIMDQPVDDDSRCRECDGACCRSFNWVVLSWSEYERLRELGAMRLHFPLSGPCMLDIENGCEFLHDGCCRIYPDRPDTCRRFFCQDISPPH